jgi:hypothetical protein
MLSHVAPADVHPLVVGFGRAPIVGDIARLRGTPHQEHGTDLIALINLSRISNLGTNKPIRVGMFRQLSGFGICLEVGPCGGCGQRIYRVDSRGGGCGRG